MPNATLNRGIVKKELKPCLGLKTIFNQFLEILYPKTCLICHNPLADNTIDNILCSDCRSGIKGNIPPLCIICGRQIRAQELKNKAHPACLRKNFAFQRALSPYKYEGIIREIIHKFKYQNRDYLSPFLGGLLINFIRQQHLNMKCFDLIMPIPLHKIRLKEREFNQAELLACRIAKEFSLPLSLSNLRRKYQRKPQVELSKEERWKNIENAFSLDNPEQIKGKNILLIDDVLTTAATSHEASSLLKAGGAGNIFVLTLAN
ncbi:MAG: ComF family protein [Candidatus Omnitrophica bacterium]|nr:ComF family protein [Candidatus Omnitrophota bacterium]MBU1872049.1 ComF family protein [Candidatus Omnitrophota bacterium]